MDQKCMVFKHWGTLDSGEPSGGTLWGNPPGEPSGGTLDSGEHTGELSSWGDYFVVRDSSACDQGEITCSPETSVPTGTFCNIIGLM